MANKVVSKKNVSEVLRQYMVVEDGVLNIEASAEVFKADLAKLFELQRLGQERVLEAMNAVFDQHSGSINTPVLKALVCTHLGLGPEKAKEWAQVNSAVSDILDSRPDLFSVRRGKENKKTGAQPGVTRIKREVSEDVTAEETTEVSESAAAE